MDSDESGRKVTVLFRPVRRLLAEAMAEVAEVHSISDIEAITGHNVVAIEPYFGYDERIGWDTHIVLTNDIPGYTRQAIGFTNGLLTEENE